jgi:hypothetical protein
LEVKILKECGYEESALGFSLSYNTSVERAKELLPKYAFGKSGETKFLESIYVWLDVNAPRFWWQEADTYRHSTKQSESTIHTLSRTELSNDNFEYALGENSLELLNIVRKEVLGKTEKIEILKNYLPEGFLQRRIWVMNYRTLQNVYNQRHDHKLPQWHLFCESILSQVEHPEFLKQNLNERSQNIEE